MVRRSLEVCDKPHPKKSPPSPNKRAEGENGGRFILLMRSFEPPFAHGIESS